MLHVYIWWTFRHFFVFFLVPRAQLRCRVVVVAKLNKLSCAMHTQRLFVFFLYKKCGFFIRWCRLDSCCLRGCRGWLVRLTGIPRRRLPLKNVTQQCAAFCPQNQHWKIICLFTRKHNYVKGTVSPKSKIVKFYNIDSCNLSTYYATFT